MARFADSAVSARTVPIRRALVSAFCSEPSTSAVNERVTGTIGLKLFKGHVRVVTRESPHAVYDAQLATFAESGGLFSQQSSPGFIELWTLQSRMAYGIRNRKK